MSPRDYLTRALVREHGFDVPRAVSIVDRVESAPSNFLRWFEVMTRLDGLHDERAAKAAKALQDAGYTLPEGMVRA